MILPVPPEKAKLTANDFRLFAERMWPGVSFDPLDTKCYHFGAICEHLQAVAERQIRKLALLCPIRHGKSLLTSVLFPCFLWCRNPSERIISATYSQDLTMRDAVRSRQLLESDLYKSYFGGINFTDDNNRKGYYSNTSKGERLSVSTNSRVGGFDADVVIQDDAINQSDMRSEEKKNDAKEAFKILQSRLVKTGRECVVLTGHRYAEDDVFAKLRNDYGDRGEWTWCVLPSEYNPKFSSWHNGLGWKDRRLENESLWPERYGDYAAEKKEWGHEYSAIFLQEPTAKEGVMFKADWFKDRTWYEEEDNYKLGNKLYPKSKAWRFMTCDTAISTNPDADYTVCACWDVVGPYLVLVDQLRGKFDGTQLVPKLAAFYNVHQPQFLAVEKEFVGRFVLDQLAQHNLNLKGFDARGHGDKEARAGIKAIGAEIKAEAGHIWIPDKPWVAGWLKELLAFPNATHDDQVDCLSMACILHGKYTQNVPEALTPEQIEEQRKQKEVERFNRMLHAGSDYTRFRRRYD